MARAIERFVEQEAWQIEAIQQAVARHDSGEAKFVDHDKVAEWLESWGTEKELEPRSCE